jgi:site-specific recombinase XerD
MGTKSLGQLGVEVVQRLGELGFARYTIKHYGEHFKAFASWAESEGRGVRSEGIVEDYIEWRFGVDLDSCEKPPSHVLQVRRACWMLVFYDATGQIPGRWSQGRNAPARFRPALELFVGDCVERGLSPATVSGRHADACDFLSHLERMGVATLGDVTREVVELFVVERHGSAPGAISRVISSTRCFLRCMSAQGVTDRDLSPLVPRAGRYPSRPLSKLWTPDEVRTLLSSIGREDAAGKRDFAMVLLVATYGLRQGDVVCLELSGIGWGSSRIAVVQRKTGVPNALPMTDEVGWALADWIRNGRPPQATCPYVFTRLTAPWGALTEMGTILRRRMAAAHVSPDPVAKSGPHSLRHSVATGMMAAGASVPVISSVLGHTTGTTTTAYLHSDLEGLRRCAIELEVAGHE